LGEGQGLAVRDAQLLRDEVEVRVAGLVARDLLFDDLPAGRLSVLDRRQRMAEPRRAGTEAPEGADVLASSGMTKAQAIASRRCERPRRTIFDRLDARDQPEAAVEPNDVELGQSFCGIELAIPVLAGAGSAGMAGLLGKATGFSRSPRKAPTFYGLVLAGTLGGAALSLVGVNPIRLLVFVAVLNGVAAAPFLVLVMLISNDEKNMSKTALAAVRRVDSRILYLRDQKIILDEDLAEPAWK